LAPGAPGGAKGVAQVDIGRKTRLPAKLVAAIGDYIIANEQLFHPSAASPNEAPPAIEDER
jgi:hypothetical protein